MFRFIVFFALALESAASPNWPVWFAGLPEALRTEPFGYPEGFGSWVASPAAVSVSWLAHLAFCAAAALGIRCRAACIAAAVSGWIVLSVPHFYDPPNYLIGHHHHLIWFAALLCAEPQLDAWSLDRWRAGGASACRQAGLAAASTATLWTSWVLMGFIFFFPGVWKWLVFGPTWLGGEPLRLVLFERWHELGRLPHPFFLSLAQSPWTTWAATLILVFELAFLPLVLFRRTRRAAALAGIGFHAATLGWMRISFWPLLVCYLSFVRWVRSDGADSAPKPAARSTTVVAGVLLTVNAACGIFGIDSWPFGVYPRFDRARPSILRSVEFAALDEHLREIPYDATEFTRRFGSVRWRRLLERIHDSPEPASRALAVAVWQALRARVGGLEDVRAVIVYETAVGTAPALSRLEKPVRVRERLRIPQGAL